MFERSVLDQNAVIEKESAMKSVYIEEMQSLQESQKRLEREKAEKRGRWSDTRRC